MPLETMELAGETVRGRMLVRGFDPDMRDWHEEGLGRFRRQDGKLRVDAREGGYTAFCKRTLPADILVRYRCRLLPPDGPNNINLISHCRSPQADPWPLVEKGRYKGYQKLPNYIVTFVSGRDEDTGVHESAGRQRLRRNPGFRLIEEKTEMPNESGREYEIRFATQGGRVRYWIDGKNIFDWQDPDPLPGGHFGLRTYKTVQEYSQFSIWELAPHT